MADQFEALRKALDNDYTRYMGEWAIYERRTPCHWGGEHEEYVIGTKHDHPQLKAPYPIVEIGQGVPPVKGDPPIPVLSIRKEHAEYIVAADPSTVRALLSELSRLRAEVERLRPNAERYEWLRDNWGYLSDEYEGGGPVMSSIFLVGKDDGWDVDPDSMDRCVDAARSAAQGGGDV